MGTDAAYMRKYRATDGGRRATARTRWIRRRIVDKLLSDNKDLVEELRRKYGREFDERWPK